MKTPEKEPLRGEAAWRAEKDGIARRNDAAQVAAAARRAARDARLAQQGLARDRLEADNLPEQPHP
jgi:hypothetical protein